MWIYQNSKKTKMNDYLLIRKNKTSCVCVEILGVKIIKKQKYSKRHVLIFFSSFFHMFIQMYMKIYTLCIVYRKM